MNGRPAMPTLAKREAIEKLAQAVQGMSRDDLLDFHNELPEKPELEIDSKNGLATIRKKIANYLSRGLEVEEILDLWNVAFPEAWNVSYVDETDTIHYLQEPESIRQGE
jgi:hypothetical protein